MKTLILALVLMTGSFGANAVSPSSEEMTVPFGLSWGLSKVELERMGVVLTNCLAPSRPGDFSFCMADLPEEFPDTRTVFVFFDPEIGLQKMQVISTIISSDSRGFYGRARYYEKVALIVAMYGAASHSSGFVKAKKYKVDDFYQCLRHYKCGRYERIWISDDGGSVGVALRGLSRSWGYVSVTFESPDWKSVVK